MSENATTAASDEQSNGAPGHGLNGIRLTLAGMPFSSRTSSRASAGLSLTPFSITYSKVMRRAFLHPGKFRQGANNPAVGAFPVGGPLPPAQSTVSPRHDNPEMDPSLLRQP